MLPYARHEVDDDDVAAVVRALRSEWLTTGPAVDAFERDVASFAGARHAVAVSSGTAALHTAMAALGVRPGDEVVVPALTFVATANAALYVGATPVFADVDPDRLLISPDDVARKVTPRTKAIVAVDYAGHPCDHGRLEEIAARHDIALVDDACHALGAAVGSRRCGTFGDATVFSFHPAKHVATGEGGMVVTDDEHVAGAARRFRNHGIGTDHRARSAAGTWWYDMETLGYNYRLSDLHAALGSSQMARLPERLARRRALAARYLERLDGVAGVTPLEVAPGVVHAWHLFVVRLPGGPAVRQRAVDALRAAGIAANVHYRPVHLHAYYRARFGTKEGMCPEAERAAESILTLPLFPGMSEADVDRVVDVLRRAVGA